MRRPNEDDRTSKEQLALPLEDAPDWEPKSKESVLSLIIDWKIIEVGMNPRNWTSQEE